MRIVIYNLCLASLIWVLQSNTLFAQQLTENYLGFNIGTSDMHLLDEHASPLIFKRFGITPSLKYYRKNKNSIQNMEASFYHNKLKTTQDNFVTQNYSARFRYSYSYGFDFIPAKQNLKLYLGGSIHTFFNKSEYDYTYFHIPNARAITSWYWSHSVDLSTQIEYVFANDGFILVGIYIPIISNVSRPQYSPSGDYNYTTNDWNIPLFGETVIFLKNTAFNVHLNYQKPITAKLNLQLSYEFYYAAYSEPCPINIYMNTLRLGLFYRI